MEKLGTLLGLFICRRGRGEGVYYNVVMIRCIRAAYSGWTIGLRQEGCLSTYAMIEHYNIYSYDI